MSSKIYLVKFKSSALPSFCESLAMKLDNLRKSLVAIEMAEGSSLTRVKILLYLYEVHHTTGGQIAKVIGYKSGGYTRHIGKLKKNGLITQLARGFYEISPKGKKLVDTMMGKYYD